MAISRIGGTTPKTSTGGGIKRINAGPTLQKQAPAPVVQLQPETKSKKGIIQEAGKFLARTAVGFADLVTESLDFTTNFVVNNPIFNVGERVAVKTVEKIAGKESKVAIKQKEQINKWKDIYTGLAEKPKQAVDNIQKTEYLQPSKEWTEAPLKEKLTKHLGETLAVLGPNIIPSFALYAVNPALGVLTTIASTANDVKTGAIENGVDERKAELLGLGTGVLVGALDRIVPDELFSPAQKAKFIANFVKRIIPLSIKEAGTEIAQENIQIIAEKTFREDLGWDEIKTRNAMAGLGGLLGGAGATMVVGTINNSFRQDILLEGEENIPPAVPPVIPEGKIEAEKVQEVVPELNPLAEAITVAPEAGKVVKTYPKVMDTDELIKLTTERGGGFRTEEQISALKESIKVNGIKYPVELTINEDGTYEINDGVHRIQIAKDLGIKKVPVKVVKDESVTQKPLGEVKIKPRIKVAPRAQLPVSVEGKEKVSRLEARVKDALGKVSTEDQERLGLATYNQMNRKENIAKASEYVTNNPDEALSVLEGKKDAPKGIARNSIYVAMESMAKGDVELARRLASLESTRMGQELSILAEIDPESPVKIMRDIIEIRSRAFERRYGGRKVKEVTDKVISDIKKSVKAPDRVAWVKFIDEIEC